MPRAVDFNLYLITDRRLATGGLLAAVEAALVGGVRAVQLREKDLTTAQLRPLALELRQLTARFGARLLINSDLDLALEVGADGVHLPSNDRRLAQARQQLGPARLLGVSTHSLDELNPATAAGADFVTFGPVFATPSKLPLGDPVGVEWLLRAVRDAAIPVFALGGIGLEQLQQLPETDTLRIALISGILAAADPKDAARQFLQRL